MPNGEGSRHGIEVRVWNERGEVILPLDVSDDVPPGVVASEKGAWLATSRTGQTISALVSADMRADLAEGACFNDTLVEVAQRLTRALFFPKGRVTWAACCCPSDIRRRRVRIGGLRGWPRPRAIGRGACRRPRTPCRPRSGSPSCSPHVAARIERDTRLLDHPVLARAKKAHREQHQIRLELRTCCPPFPASPCGHPRPWPIRHARTPAPRPSRSGRWRAWSTPPNHGRSLPRAHATCAASAASPARSAPCSRAPAASAKSRAA